jgi:predicted ATPase
VERVYLRARELSYHIGETAQLFPALYGLWVFHYIRSEFRTAHALGEDFLRLAQQHDDPTTRLVAHRLVGTTWFFLGEFCEARNHLEQALRLYDPQQHRDLALQYSQDVGVAGLIFLSWTLCLLGYPDQALARAHEALALARNVSHPFSLAFALNTAATVHQFRRETHAAHELAEAAVTLCREQGFAFWLAYGIRTRSLALATLGQGEQGLTQLHQSLEASHMRTLWLALLAEAYGKVEQAKEGLRALTEALATVDATAEHCWEGELHRLKGELLLQSGVWESASLGPLFRNPHAAEAETCFRQALDVARRQQAKALELRATMSLSRLWQRQDKRAEAHQSLAEIYGWFTEGFDTADLQEAKVLLEEFGREGGAV